MIRPSTRAAALASLVCTLPALLAGGAPHEDAFIQIWGLHRQTPDNHEAVVDACREAAQKRSSDGSPLLGAYLPVVQTVEGWRLLKLSRTDEAARAFESVLDQKRSADPLVSAADTLARRWLSRMDRETVAAALRTYHREQIEFPADLSAFAAWPRERQPPLRDRLGAPWVYRLTAFRRITTAPGQQYSLHSLSIGRTSSVLATALLKTQPETPITFVPKHAAPPALVEFRVGTPPDLKISVLQEGSASEGLRFAALDSLGRFALLTDSDFWLTALPAGGPR